LKFNNKYAANLEAAQPRSADGHPTDIDMMKNFHAANQFSNFSRFQAIFILIFGCEQQQFESYNRVNASPFCCVSVGEKFS